MMEGWGKGELKLYNSMMRKAETFIPREPGKVRIYVCDITVYDLSHLGHACTVIAFDVLFCYLKYLEYDITYVLNFTNVDDKIIRRTKEIGEDAASLVGDGVR